MFVAHTAQELRSLVIAVYRELEVANHLYAEASTQQARHSLNGLVVSLQQQYARLYALYQKQKRTEPDTTHGDYLCMRATAILTRARSNLTRQLDDPHWQEMASNQHKRARAIMRRARAYKDTE